MVDRYIMKDGQAVPCEDLMEWARWIETAERSIGRDVTKKGVRISTVFLGLDHGFPWARLPEADYKPVLWETMIFGGPLDQEQWRYDDLENARAGHKRAARMAGLMDDKLLAFWFMKVEPFWKKHITPYLEMI